MSEHVHQQIVPDELAGSRLDQALAQMFPQYSRSRLTTWVKSGEVTVDGAVVKPRAKVIGGEQIELKATMDELGTVTAAPIEFGVAYEDEAVIVINKPAGLVVHPGAGNAQGTLQNGLLHRWPELAELPRAGIVHRIDKDTTGLMLVARTLEAHTHLARQIAEREVHREYRAVCYGVLTGGATIKQPIGRHPQERIRMSVRVDGREAVTHYRVMERFAAHTLVQVMLETGRTHQIRVHFAFTRHALVGDPVYSGRLRLPPGNDVPLADALRAFRRQALHAAILEFTHPVSGETIRLEAPLPADMVALIDELRAHAKRVAEV